MKSKKILSALLSISILFSMSATADVGMNTEKETVESTVSNQKSVRTGGSCGTNVVWTLKDDGSLLLEGTGEMPNYDSSSSYTWNEYSSEIKTVIMESGVSSIGNFAFGECSNLTDIYYAGTAEQWEQVSVGSNNDPFLNAKVHFIDSICEHVYEEWTIYSNARCTVDGEKSGECALCGEITDEVIPARGHKYEETICEPTCVNRGYTKYHCKRCLDTYCDNYVDSLGHSYGEWTPDEENTSDVTAVYDRKCTRCGNTETKKSGSVGENITWTLDAEGTFTLSGTGIMENISYWALPWRDDLLNIKKVIIEDGVEKLTNGIFEGCSNLISVTMGDSLEEISSSAFADCSSLVSVTIGSGVRYIVSGAFESCTSLMSVVVPSSIYGAIFDCFLDCPYIENVYYTGGKLQWEQIVVYHYVEKKLNAYDLFPDNAKVHFNFKADCSHEYGDCISSIRKRDDGDYRIYTRECRLCQYMEYTKQEKAYEDNIVWKFEDDILTISGTGSMYSYSSYTDLPWYEYQTKVKKVIIEEGVTGICDFAFANFRWMISVTIPNTVNSIGSHAFTGCSSLESVIIPNGVVSIGYRAFEDCFGLKFLVIGSGITKIIDEAFRGCSKLKYVTMTYSVENIGTCAFVSCNAISDVYYLGTEEEWRSIFVRDGNSGILSAKVHFEYYPPDEFTLEYENPVFTPKFEAGQTLADIGALYPEYQTYVYDKGGVLVPSSNDIAKTGYRVVISDGETVVGSSVVIVNGDGTGDGVVNGKDLIRMKKQMLLGDAVEYSEFVDYNGDGVVDDSDAEYLMSMVK